MNLLLQEALNKATPIRSGLLQQATPAPLVTPKATPAPVTPAPVTPRATPVVTPVATPRSIDATSVITPPTVPTPYTPKQTPLQTFDSAAQVGQDGVVRLQNEYTKQMDTMRDTISDFQLGTQDTFQNKFDELAEQQGYKDGKTLMNRLTDESAKLAQIQGKYRTREYDITTSPETKATQSGLLTEMDRRSQIEVGNQALLVQALQGSYNTARQTAMDVATLAYQDKREEIDALKWQYDQISGIVEGEQKQILDERRRLLDQEEAQLEEGKTWIQSAIQNRWCKRR
jgi:soluble cytochrome b562